MKYIGGIKFLLFLCVCVCVCVCVCKLFSVQDFSETT